MKKLSDLENDYACLEECEKCSNFGPFKRAIERNQAALYSELAQGDVTNQLRMGIVQGVLKVYEVIIKTPEEVMKRVNQVANIKNARRVQRDNLLKSEKGIML